MKLGMCCGVNQADALARAGIPNIELTVNTITGWTAEELRANMRLLRDAGVALESCNCLISGFSLYADEGLVRSRELMEKTMHRLGEAGIRYVVFGSGGYRRVPEGMDKTFARAKIEEFLHLLSEICRPYGITIVIEPLNSVKACNILNTAVETAEYVRAVNKDNIQLLIDYRHFMMDGELLGTIANYRGMLQHTHIAHPCTFFTPQIGDGVDYKGFLDALRGIDYKGLVVSESTLRLPVEEEARIFREAMGL